MQQILAVGRAQEPHPTPPHSRSRSFRHQALAFTADPPVLFFTIQTLTLYSVYGELSYIEHF